MGTKPYPYLSHSYLFLYNLLFLTLPRRLCHVLQVSVFWLHWQQTIPENSRKLRSRDLKRLAGRHFFSIFLLCLLQFITSYCRFQVVQVDAHVLMHTGQNYALKLHLETKRWLAELREHWSQVSSKV